MPEEKSVRFARRDWQRGFTMIPNAVLHDGGISPGARLLWALLASYAWKDEKAWPGQDALGLDLGVSDRQVRTLTRELEGNGLVEVVRRGRNRTNLYVLHEPGPEGNFRVDRKDSSAPDRKSSSGEEEREYREEEEDDAPMKISAEILDAVPHHLRPDFPGVLGKLDAIASAKRCPRVPPKTLASIFAEFEDRDHAFVAEDVRLWLIEGTGRARPVKGLSQTYRNAVARARAKVTVDRWDRMTDEDRIAREMDS